jgi:hypothetical protein
MSSYFFLQCTDFCPSSAPPRRKFWRELGAISADRNFSTRRRRIQPDCLCKIFVLRRASLYQISDNRLLNACEGLTQQLIVFTYSGLENGSATAQPIQGADAVFSSGKYCVEAKVNVQ